FQRDAEHWIAVSWAEELSRSFEAGVAVLLNNGKGVLAQVAQAVSSAEADITHISMSEESQQRETAEMNLLLSVRDRLHLADVLRTLKRSPSVLRVWRVKP
ncbi:MAG TPA: ACT domain-containing protein, partial [Roseateles sp.]|nr:ACT domain-containing protein [Roseateles sp.]